MAKNLQTLPTFQEMILKLQHYWVRKQCCLVQAYDLPMGAATFHPATFFGALNSQARQYVYLQACRRPTDGRYGENPNRLQHYYQLQVLLKPPPENVQQLYLDSLTMLGIDVHKHEIRFVDDNWESPTLGAYGVGWEVWLDGMEISQFTYFQQIGGRECLIPACEMTYGLERLAMYLQDCDNIFDLAWGKSNEETISYGDMFLQSEVQQSAYNFKHAPVDVLLEAYEDHAKMCSHLSKQKLTHPAYEQIILASHVFNLLDARGAISPIERQRYILRTRKMTQTVAQIYCEPEKEGNKHA